ncbi:MAG: signal peptidase [Ilumatobacteraceae bacterium]
MADDEWWTHAVDQFGIDTSVQPDNDAIALDADQDATVPDIVPRRRRRRRRATIDWLIVATIAIGGALVLRVFVVQQFAVDGESMLETLHSGDRVIVNKLSYVAHDPRHGDVVVLEDNNASVAVRDLIKRVIALPGETIEYRECVLLINGKVVTEPYLDPHLVQTGHCGESQGPVKVELGHVFVMGDNRAASLDSRAPVIGQIPFGELIGRAVVVVWPTSDWRWL